MENSLDDILLMYDDKMSKCVEHFRSQTSALRTGKASPRLVENISVAYYGTPVRLMEIANISTPEPRLIVINPYDPTALQEIEKAITAANLGVTPINDGRVIRVPIPELSEERRAEMTKVAKRMAEENRVAVRNVRREANEAIKSLLKDGKIAEDEKQKGLDDVQKMTDDSIQEIDRSLLAKEKEFMEV